VAERWELYRNGLELGNAFGELTDAAEQRKRFAAANAFRAAHGMHAYPEPTAFYQALDRGLPESSGCAIGMDRLLMLLCGAEDIRQVRA
jgi:lysyl-tRNA synthetase class 2